MDKVISERLVSVEIGSLFKVQEESVWGATIWAEIQMIGRSQFE